METLARISTLRGTAAALYGLSHGRRALLSVAQPALGALLAAGGFPDLRSVGLGLVAATAGMLCVYAANDLLDVDVDREAARLSVPGSSAGSDGSVAPLRTRPLARGLLSERVAVVWIAGLGVVAFGAAYALRPGCALIFLACAALEVLYCALKRTTWLKTVPAGVLIGLGGTAGWYAVRDLDGGALLFFFLLATWEIFGRNLSNDLADLSLDAPLGIRTLATAGGPRWSARACFAGAVAILPVAAAQPAGWLLRSLLVTVAAWAMTLPAVGLLRRPEESVAQAYFDRASLFPPLAFAVATIFFALRSGT